MEKWMTEEECVENLQIQKDFVQVIAPGGAGQVDAFSQLEFSQENLFRVK